ncbi:hypothetical protein ElyMa_001607900 [Elysia marginata]|uniref:Uncharacterized protein n=1 Tax=Elysia marginata TaxID=1093978 RepID=A0AAV4JNA9_9GAST|nr:hypothetical protein ElyMa_001607900 [Elysia marginata]
MVKYKRNNELDKAAEDIDKLPDHARMFKTVKSLNRKKSENPKIFDADGKFITNIDEIQTVIGKHFKDKLTTLVMSTAKTPRWRIKYLAKCSRAYQRDVEFLISMLALSDH